MPDGQANRREFLKWSAVSGITGSLLPKVAHASKDLTETSKVKSYNRLGRTGLEISDISFGSSALDPSQISLVHHALDRGVNYFDSADSYRGGASEIALGQALKGTRKDVHIVSKMVTRTDTTADEIMATLHQSLRRLQTDYVDIYMCHAVNDLGRIQSEEWIKFVEQAKSSGKIRFSGMSGHAGRLAECLEYGINQDWTDVVLVAYNFGQDPNFLAKFTQRMDFVAIQPELPRLLEKAKENDVGVTVMKTLRGARLNDMRPYETEGSTFAQAAFRWVLSNKNVDAVVVTMNDGKDQIDEYLGASGSRDVAYGDYELLELYAKLNAGSYCEHACNDCSGACPYGVQISEVLRTRMYATDYRNLTLAREEYNLIEQNAAACLSCSGEPCKNACTHGLAINELCGATHTMLS